MSLEVNPLQTLLFELYARRTLYFTSRLTDEANDECIANILKFSRKKKLVVDFFVFLDDIQDVVQHSAHTENVARVEVVHGILTQDISRFLTSHTEDWIQGIQVVDSVDVAGFGKSVVAVYCEVVRLNLAIGVVDYINGVLLADVRNLLADFLDDVSQVIGVGFKTLLDGVDLFAIHISPIY
jgi:hypothetical protein